MGLRETTRRRFVALGAAVGLTGLAGCSNALGDDGGSGSPTETPTDDATGTPTETAAPTDSPTATPDPGIRTVFHFAGEESAQEHALSNVENLVADDSVEMAEIVLVANGRGLFLLGEQSNHPDRVAALVDDGVSFRACENSMEALDVSEEELLSGVETVPAGVGELSRLQADGFGYIRTP